MKKNIIIIRILGCILLFLGLYPFAATYFNLSINLPPSFNMESVNTANTITENLILDPGLTGLKVIAGLCLILNRPGAKQLTLICLSLDIFMRFFTYATPCLPPYAGWRAPELNQLLFQAIAGRANLYRTRPDELIHLNPVSIALMILQISMVALMFWIYFIEKKKKTQQKNSGDAVPSHLI